ADCALSIDFTEISMSSPQLRRADRAMSAQQASAMLERGFSGRLATVGADGYPYCIPLLYIRMEGGIYVHTGSARGHLRANVERAPVTNWCAAQRFHGALQSRAVMACLTRSATGAMCGAYAER